VAANFSALVRGLALEDPQWQESQFNRTPVQRASEALEMEKTIQRWRSQNAQQIIAEFRRGRLVNWNRLEYGPWVEARQKVSTLIVGLIKAALELLSVMLPRIACPTLIMTGDSQEGATLDAKSASQIAA
jgi:pimeloyl-ACP methyl ester carboxylesterase